MSHVSKDYVKAITEGASWASVGVKKSLNECADDQPVVEHHVCPLCESTLKEPISESALLEHSAAMLEVFNAVEETLNESVEDLTEEEDLDEEEEYDEEEDYDEEDESEEDEE